MKILDLGAHDGFVGTWLGRQLPEQLHIDGVEANPDAVRIANERREGNPGVYVQGLAEDAESIFQLGDYDAVVAFELIEHVVDVPAFLTVCERMCKHNGRVYLSTPTGTFGEGNNPHHLRAYRAIDLFEVCKHRGNVEDMELGQDGVTVISYTPGEQHKPELAIYCGPGWEKWHPTDIETKGLGGSETAAVRLSVALSERYNVTVYGECDFCAFRQVTFKPHHTFDPLEERDVVISSRMPWLVDRPVEAATRLLWMHDTDYGDGLNAVRAEKFDGIMVLSEWHKHNVLEKYPFISENQLHITGNAIEPEYFDYEELERSNVCLYSSSPDRGLDLLLALWPEVRKQVPDAELHYCYSSVYDKVAATNPIIAKHRDRIVELSKQPGITNLGSLTQPQVAKKMGAIKAWLAPSFSTPAEQKFYETYCIGAQEAAAAGACLIVSEWGALPERLADAVNSVAIPASTNGSPLIKDEWVSAIVNAMTVPVHQRSLSALSMTWEKRADEFDQVIYGGLASITR